MMMPPVSLPVTPGGTVSTMSACAACAKQTTAAASAQRMNPLPVRNPSRRVRYRAVQHKPAAPILPEVWHRRDSSAASHTTPPELRYCERRVGGVRKKRSCGHEPAGPFVQLIFTEVVEDRVGVTGGFMGRQRGDLRKLAACRGSKLGVTMHRYFCAAFRRELAQRRLDPR